MQIVSKGRQPEHARSAAALIAALEDVLLAARTLLAALDPVAGYASPTGAPRTDSSGALSVREREVLGLLATGHSNRRIAAALFLSPRTVQPHVANVYLKLGAHCRAEATVYALRHDLAWRCAATSSRGTHAPRVSHGSRPRATRYRAR